MGPSSQPGSELSLPTERHGAARLVRAIGRVDFSTTPRFQEVLGAEADGIGVGGGLVVDLGGLDLITSAGLRALMQTKKRLAGSGGALVVTGAAGTVAEVIRVSRFDTLLTMKPTAAEGLALFAPDPG